MSTLLPLDSDNNPIPALRLKSGAAHTISAGVSSARNTAAFNANTKVVSLYADVPVYINFGGVTVMPPIIISPLVYITISLSVAAARAITRIWPCCALVRTAPPISLKRNSLLKKMMNELTNSNQAINSGA